VNKSLSAVSDLLTAAAHGRVGVDRRFVQSILDRGPEAAAEVLAFSRASHENEPVLLDELMVDLFRQWNTQEAMDYFIDLVRRDPEAVDDALVQALLPFGERALQPLLELYEELGEEQGSDIAFLLAALRIHDPRVLALLLDRLEYDAADGAFCLGLYGDPAARPELERVLAELPSEPGAKEDEASNARLKREVQFALEQLSAPEPSYQPQPVDILAQYPQRALPEFDVLPEPERIELLQAPEADVRTGAAGSFFNNQVSPKARQALLEAANSDADAKVRGKAWASLADATEDDSIREAMLAVLGDHSRPVEERGGAAVGLYAVADQDPVREALESLYAEGGKARVKALDAMWRSLWKPYAKYFPPHLDDPDPEIVRQALRGTGYFQQTRFADKVASYFERHDEFEDLREDALFAYALAMPGETTRGRIRGMLRKIDTLANLKPEEVDLVEFALDERLKLHGLDPVFSAEGSEVEEAPASEPPPPQKVGRNDPCPCGSGKKYKKCHGQ
jgi:hypothetical protein